ncbi:MAG TPA: alcohol dehydrogenase catalytic domain-containing protein [Bryobacteraceae bacterium]|nr:alcohol dehydrogenase catalytic domain-containing protein [Bryobacteraceae bacterium]
MPTRISTDGKPVLTMPGAATLPEAAATMRAAVYRGSGRVDVEAIPVPEIGAGEILVQVETCGICHTDLKKIAYDLLEPPRVYGHETAGIVAAVGSAVKRFRRGDRVVVFHHIPCGECFYCHRKLFAQCPVYKKVGVTAGFEPAGGGFAQYVRVMDWIVERGVEKIPEGVSFDQACFVEPVNTCLKGFKQIDPQPEDTVAILGQGPIGLIFTMMAARTGSRVIVTDSMASRRGLALSFGVQEAFNPLDENLEARMKSMTGGRGADLVIVAASAPGIVQQAVACSRPGARILLFAQTSHQERIEVSGADVCVAERAIFGSYSASVDLQRESADLVFRGALPVQDLITHRVTLNDIHSGIERALHPDEVSLKIVVQPQR